MKHISEILNRTRFKAVSVPQASKRTFITVISQLLEWNWMKVAGMLKQASSDEARRIYILLCESTKRESEFKSFIKELNRAKPKPKQSKLWKK